MNHQHISLQSLYVSEHAENMYAKIIAEEDIKETYGTEIIISERIYPYWQHIF